MAALANSNTSAIGAQKGLFLLFIIAVSLVASVSVYLWPKSQGGGYFLGDQVDHYLDMEGTEGIGEIIAKGASFEPSGGKLVNRGVQGGAQTALWLRYKVPELPGSPQHDWTLSLQETRVREVRLYVETEPGIYRERVSHPGIRDPVSGLVRGLPHLILKPQNSSARQYGSESTRDLRSEPCSGSRAEKPSSAAKLRQTLMFGILTGILVALFCYLLALGAILKEGALAMLAVFVMFFCIYVVSDRAFVESLMLPGALRVSRFMSIASTLGCYATWTAFLLIYLRTNIHFIEFMFLLSFPFYLFFIQYFCYY